MTEQANIERPVRRDGQPPFSEAWQAQILAMADNLQAKGLFTASEWSDQLGLELKKADQASAEDDLDTYFTCALTALETLIADKCDINLDAMQNKRKDRESAYLSTPHGQPVELGACRT
jgi:nitrile hydratase accessory protein